MFGCLKKISQLKIKSHNPLRIYFSACFFFLFQLLFWVPTISEGMAVIFFTLMQHTDIKAENYQALTSAPHRTNVLCMLNLPNLLCAKNAQYGCYAFTLKKKAEKKAICQYILPSFVSKGKSFLHVELESVLNVNFNLSFV